MTLVDRRGHPVTGATARAVELHEAALAQFQCYRGDPLATIDQAIAEAPGFAMGRALKAYLGILATEKPLLAMARAELEALERLTVTSHEAGHRAAIRALTTGDWEGGIAALDTVLSEHPRDVLALQAVHLANFYTGDARNLRDAVARVRG